MVEDCNDKSEEIAEPNCCYRGFQLPLRSCSPSSVLECNTSMAFSDLSRGPMSFDLGSDHSSSFYPLRRPAALCPGSMYTEEKQAEGEEILRGAKEEEEQELQVQVPCSESFQASSVGFAEDASKPADAPGSPARRDSPEDSTGEDCDVKNQCSKRRKTVQKRIVWVPVGRADGRQKNDGPPSDLWAWRKYGQKPIKGSPYPRGYYRCSSSKGCCARKQVERSCTDPSMLVITYTSEHNHPWPVNRTNSNSGPKQSQEPAPTVSEKSSSISQEGAPLEPCSSDNPFSFIINSSERLEQSVVSSMEMQAEEPLAFIQDVELCISRSTQTEEDDFYADLGELPESSAIFSSRGFFEEDESTKISGIDRCSLLSWSGGCLLGNNAVI
eukprot:Gb_25547 [translate_table: standard]